MAVAPTKNAVVFMSDDTEGVVARKVNSLPITATKNRQKVMAVIVFKTFFSFCKAEPSDSGRGMGLRSGAFRGFPMASSRLSKL
jgi:hypothetical protein